jgi:hypothetical protein
MGLSRVFQRAHWTSWIGVSGLGCRAAKLASDVAAPAPHAAIVSDGAGVVVAGDDAADRDNVYASRLGGWRVASEVVVGPQHAPETAADGMSESQAASIVGDGLRLGGRARVRAAA